MKGLLLFILMTQMTSALAEAEFIDIPDFQYEPQSIGQAEDLIQILPFNYQVRKDASYCIRPIEMIDTITIHHSEGRSTDTASSINAYHITRGSASDPWYMIGYSYVINTPYAGESKPKSAITVGRPLTIVGAHAGSGIFLPMDEVQQQLWDSKQIKCGKTGQAVFDPTVVQNGKIKANVTSIGVVVVGNYSLFSGKYIVNSRGKRVVNPQPNLNGDIPARKPTDKSIDMIARLSCQLQKQHPRIKNFTYHRQYHATSCPGSFENYMDEIKAKAKEYGCEFKVIPGKYY